MAAKRYRVMVFTGVKRLDLVRQIGWSGQRAPPPRSAAEPRGLTVRVETLETIKQQTEQAASRAEVRVRDPRRGRV